MATSSRTRRRGGCSCEKAPGDGSHEGDGDDSITCPNEKGQPRFIFTKSEELLCGITKGFDAECMKVWNKLGQMRPH